MMISVIVFAFHWTRAILVFSVAFVSLSLYDRMLQVYIMETVYRCLRICWIEGPSFRAAKINPMACNDVSSYLTQLKSPLNPASS